MAVTEPGMSEMVHDSVIMKRATRLEQPLRRFVISHYDDEVTEISKEERAYIDLTTTKIYATVIDSWADGEEWEIGVCQPIIRDTLWGATSAHPIYPLPGPDDKSTALVNFLAETLSLHVTKNDIGQLHQETRLAAEIVARWCAAPLA